MMLRCCAIVSCRHDRRERKPKRAPGGQRGGRGEITIRPHQPGEYRQRRPRAPTWAGASHYQEPRHESRSRVASGFTTSPPFGRRKTSISTPVACICPSGRADSGSAASVHFPWAERNDRGYGLERSRRLPVKPRIAAGEYGVSDRAIRSELGHRHGWLRPTPVERHSPATPYHRGLAPTPDRGSYAGQERDGCTRRLRSITLAFWRASAANGCAGDCERVEDVDVLD